MRKEIEGYVDDDGCTVCVLADDGRNIWLFTKAIHEKNHANIPVIAEGKWQTLSDLREIRRAVV